VRSREIHPKFRRQKRKSGGTQQNLLLLDQFRLEDLRRWNKYGDDLLRYQAIFYTSLAVQRSQIYPKLLAALEKASSESRESGWQRCVSAKWELDPLSARGSILDPIGGRFNIGDLTNHATRLSLHFT